MPKLYRCAPKAKDYYRAATFYHFLIAFQNLYGFDEAIKFRQYIFEIFPPLHLTSSLAV